MACCFSGDPIEGDEKALREHSFHVSMKNAPAQAFPACAYG